jgi:REP element-mobilizing transposase RayT
MLSSFGNTAQLELNNSISIRKELSLDQWVVMPNHIHLIVVLTSEDYGELGYKREAGQREKRSISSFVAGYKGAVTARINTLRRTPGQPVWQRSFHDHIIRSEKGLHACREYIVNNPMRWHLDKEHPDSIPSKVDELDLILHSDYMHAQRRPV